MGEIQEIMRQFCHGGDGCQWHKFLRSIKIENIHGWTGQEVKFNFPVVAIVGENGIGKSTFLKAAACAYKNTPFPKQYTILSNKWGAVHCFSCRFFCYFCIARCCIKWKCSRNV